MAAKPLGKPFVDQVLSALLGKAPGKVDERTRRRLVRDIALLERALAANALTAGDRDRVKAALEDRAPLYRFLTRTRVGAKWSVAEIEGAPFFTRQEKSAWFQIEQPVKRAQFVVQVMAQRVAALNKLSEKSDDLEVSAAKLRVRMGKA
jgi:hypothetical protein